MAEKTLTKLLDILRYSTELLKSKKIENARLNTELMLCDTLKCDRVKLYLDFDKPLTKDERDLFKIKLLRRIKGEPLQYILGYTDFFNVKIFLNNSVLIPRPETEELIAKVIDKIKENKSERIKIYEAATGSGCISIALAKALENMNIEFEITCSDISDRALELAKYNAGYNKIKNLKYEIKDFFKLETIGDDVNIFIMNPPYVSKEEYNLLEKVIKDWEPENAVTDEGDGYSFYVKMFEMIKNGKLESEMIFCEIGYNQEERLKFLMDERNITCFQFFKDLSGNYRILFIENESSNSKS